MKNTTMNVAQREAKTIEIGLGEYRLLIVKTYLLDKITDYVDHCGDYINDDVIRALLGVNKPSANLESEGD